MVEVAHQRRRRSEGLLIRGYARFGRWGEADLAITPYNLMIYQWTSRGAAAAVEEPSANTLGLSNSSLMTLRLYFSAYEGICGTSPTLVPFLSV